MNELTDLEICQRIAEIEGLEISCEWDCGNNGILIGKGDGDLKDYNPLTDDALCFKLMVKHNVSLTYGDYAVTAEILIEKEDGEHSFAAQAYCPKRAICVAIIKSKE